MHNCTCSPNYVTVNMCSYEPYRPVCITNTYFIQHHLTIKLPMAVGHNIPLLSDTKKGRQTDNNNKTCLLVMQCTQNTVHSNQLLPPG